MSDMYVHLERGRSSFESGRWQEASAQCDAILLTGTVRYEVQFEGRAIHAEERARRAIDEAVAMWSDVADDVVFEEVSGRGYGWVGFSGPPAGRSRTAVEVVIVFSPDGRRGNSPSAGHIAWQRWVGPLPQGGFGARVQARIDIRTELPGGQVPMNLAQMRHAVAHEIGHLLGLDDSPSVGDVMGPLDLARPATEPSFEEALALRELRAAARHIRLRSLLSALSEGGRYNLWRVASR
ncbi:MAG: hypothetical protein SNJ76_03290 [Fimbriimonadaceae bacterium]